MYNRPFRLAPNSVYRKMERRRTSCKLRHSMLDLAQGKSRRAPSSICLTKRRLTVYSSYWDAELKPEKYSCVDAALDAEYSIMIYDRLGTGLSGTPGAHDIVQGPLQIEMFNQLTVLACARKLGESFAKYQSLTVPEIPRL